MTRLPETAGVTFVCNICRNTVEGVPVEAFHREAGSCSHCGSTVRWRSIVHGLSLALFGESLALPDFPANKHIRGIGLSDEPLYAAVLQERFSYANTFIHKEPLLDIMAPDPEHLARYHFLISGDVFEHVLPPVKPAFDHSFALLRPGGHLILTVPYGNIPETIEHFPHVRDFKIADFDGEYVMVHRDHSGRYSLRTDLTFHGGGGATLEMRVFARNHIVELLSQAGFTGIRFLDEPVYRWGILFNEPFGFPILAHRPKP